MATLYRPLLLIALCLAAAACEPRGETRSLSDVFETSKRRFTDSKSANVPQGPSAALQAIPPLIEQLATQLGPQSPKIAGEVADLLNSLVDHAGYTSRPGFTELINQYRMMTIQRSEGEQAAARLLVARTYSLLASELETTRFSVQ